MTVLLGGPWKTWRREEKKGETTSQTMYSFSGGRQFKEPVGVVSTFPGEGYRLAGFLDPPCGGGHCLVDWGNSQGRELMPGAEVKPLGKQSRLFCKKRCQGADVTLLTK